MKRYNKIYKEEFFYNYSQSEKDEELYFCSNNPEDSKHYGHVLRIFTPTEHTLDLRYNSSDKDKLVLLAKHFLSEWTEEEISDNGILELINPIDIIDSAGAWDNIEFINYLYDLNWFNKYDGVITNNGAIFFEINKNNLVSKETL